MKVIFLDIDGVLTAPRSFSPFFQNNALPCGLAQKKIDLLRSIVQKTDAKLVLSSTWRIEFSTDMIPNSAIGQSLANVFASNDIPLCSRTNSQSISSRPYEIQGWLHTHPDVSSFIIIDDNDFGWGDLSSHWLSIKSATGLTQADAKKAIAMLIQ